MTVDIMYACCLPCYETVGGGWWVAVVMVYRCKYYVLHMTLFSHCFALCIFRRTDRRTNTFRQTCIFILTFSLLHVYSKMHRQSDKLMKFLLVRKVLVIIILFDIGSVLKSVVHLFSSLAVDRVFNKNNNNNNNKIKLKKKYYFSLN